MSSAKIHPSAIVSPNAKIGDDVVIGPYCVIDDGVTIGSRTVLHSHVCISGLTTIGEGNQIFPFAALGFCPQDLKYSGEKSYLIIGDNNTIREHVTMHLGTSGGNMKTVVGNDCLFMAGVHVAHDCIIQDSVIMANQVTLGGHVVVERHATIGGLCAVHQFVRIGAHAMIGGMSGVEKDVVPYASVMGERAWVAGINLVGLKRHGFSREAISTIRTVYNQLFSNDLTFEKRIEQISNQFKDSPEILNIISFLKADRSRAVCLPRNFDDIK